MTDQGFSGLKIDCKITMKEIGPIAEIDHKITMKEIGPIAETDRENTMTKINHAKGTDHQSITKLIMKESIIIHLWTMEIGVNIKIVIKTNIGMKISMIVIDLMIQIIPKVEIGHMTETGHIVEIGHIVETDHETTVEMSTRKKVINVREGLEIIMKTPMRTGMIGININTNTEMKAII